MKVTNLEGKTGRSVPNQFKIESELGTLFQSYNSTICYIDKQGKVTLDPVYWDYSRTTKKYLCKFLGVSNSELNENIKKGLYKLANLN